MEMAPLGSLDKLLETKQLELPIKLRLSLDVAKACGLFCFLELLL